MKFPKIIVEKGETTTGKMHFDSKEAEKSDDIDIKNKPPLKPKRQEKCEAIVTEETINTDYIIIHDIVIEKFKEITAKYLERSLHRRNRLKQFQNEDLENSDLIETQFDSQRNIETYDATRPIDQEKVFIND